MLVVVDAFVLIHLSRIGRFQLIKSLYGSAVVSPGVYHGLLRKVEGASLLGN